MARSFDDASSEYLEIDSAPATAYPLTMAGWFYTDTFAVNQNILYLGDKDSNNLNYHSLWLNGGARRVTAQTVGAAGAGSAIDTLNFSLNTWHHACGVWANATSRDAFLDGGNKGSNANNQTPGGIDRVSIGRQGDSTPTYYMSGYIADAVIYNVALSDAEVALLSKGISPLLIQPQAIVAYWPLIRDDDLDWVGGYHLTAYNTPTVATHPPLVFATPPALSYPVVAAPAEAPTPILSKDGIHSLVFGGQVISG